jgi:hypothetical protein
MSLRMRPPVHHKPTPGQPRVSPATEPNHSQLAAAPVARKQ